jgi:hypothetical protein
MLGGTEVSREMVSFDGKAPNIGHPCLPIPRIYVKPPEAVGFGSTHHDPYSSSYFSAGKF